MSLRKKFIAYLFSVSQNIYVSVFKKQAPWKVKTADLLNYPEASFGKALGLFLNLNNFELIPKVERHDAYHVLTGYGTNAEDEIALQYLCYGNGKRSPYLFGVVIIGALILPEYLGYYIKSYRAGKAAHAFHHYNYEKLLKVPLSTLRASFFNKKYLQEVLVTPHV
jgi:hypothetical protein